MECESEERLCKAFLGAVNLFILIPVSGFSTCLPSLASRFSLLLPLLDEQIEAQQRQILDEIGLRNTRWLDQEVTKLDRWSEDLKLGLEQEIKDLDKEIRDTKRASSSAASLADKLAHQRTIKTLQTLGIKSARIFL